MPARASCRFCRTRKLKCVPAPQDGIQVPCQACLARGQECIHDDRAVMGRPLKRARTSSTVPDESKSASTATRRREQSIGALLSDAYGDLFQTDIECAPPTISSSATSFQSPCRDTSASCSAFKIALEKLRQHQAHLPIPDAADEADQVPCGSSTYPAIIQLMNTALLEMCISHLAPYLQLKTDRYYAIALTRDSHELKVGERDELDLDAFVQPVASTSSSSREDALFLKWEKLHPLACLFEESQKSKVMTEHERRSSPLLNAMWHLSLSEALELDASSDNSAEDSRRLQRDAESFFSDCVVTASSDYQTATLSLLSLMLAMHHMCRGRAKIGTAYLALSSHLLERDVSKLDHASSLTALLRATIASFEVWALLSLACSTSTAADCSGVFKTLSAKVDGVWACGDLLRATLGGNKRSLFVLFQSASLVASLVGNSKSHRGLLQSQDSTLSSFGSAARSLLAIGLSLSQLKPNTSERQSLENVWTHLRAVHELAKFLEAPRQDHRVFSKISFGTAISDQQGLDSDDAPTICLLIGSFIKVGVALLEYARRNEWVSSPTALSVCRELEQLCAHKRLAGNPGIEASKGSLNVVELNLTRRQWQADNTPPQDAPPLNAVHLGLDSTSFTAAQWDSADLHRFLSGFVDQSDAPSACAISPAYVQSEADGSADTSFISDALGTMWGEPWGSEDLAALEAMPPELESG
ncbi:Zn(2)-C6 fungal-type DNA-binding domain [Ceraceosorus bombacis]|uniref:Zn(2)-C6 fungal-type DNA-binding domain n=1 Tax=Ceraceosorus bombacis TaxID=401625 RepID=A0A0P1BAY7_9BASI|nr:Zn(2)-C6 fungal-type DNA-binding domain [Ceraceosorus bombacis]